LESISKSRHKDSFQFRSNEKSLLYGLVIQTCTLCIAYRWPGHWLSAFTIASLSISLAFWLFFVRTAKVFWRLLTGNLLAILALALYLHWKH
jgi:hypothetical protein